MAEPTQWTNPTIEGTLVTLRPFGPDDIDAVWEMINDPEGNDLTATTDEFDYDQIREWYLTRNDHYDRIDVAIVENATGELAGEVVFNEHEPEAKTCSFRISLRGPAWFGRGLGTEATELIVDHGFRQLGLDRIELEVLARNPRAKRAYEKAGFVVTGHVTEDGEDWVHMAVTAVTAQPD
jgi:RimJ/RimL family protein N-acetyltransferase